MSFKFVQLLNKDINKISRFFLSISFSLMIIMILFLTIYIFIPPFVINDKLYISFFNIDLIEGGPVDIYAKYLNVVGILSTMIISIIIPMSGYGYWKYKKSDYLAKYNSNHISAFMIIGNIFLLVLFIVAFINRPSSIINNNPWLVQNVLDSSTQSNIFYENGVFVNRELTDEIGVWEFSYIFNYNFNKGNSESISFTWWELRIGAQVLIFYISVFYLALIIVISSILYTNNFLIDKNQVFNITKG